MAVEAVATYSSLVIVLSEPIIIPYQEPIQGLVKHEGQTFEVSQHYAQGKDMKGLNFTHMMFNEKGAFWLVAK